MSIVKKPPHQIAREKVGLPACPDCKNGFCEINCGTAALDMMLVVAAAVNLLEQCEKRTGRRVKAFERGYDAAVRGMVREVEQYSGYPRGVLMGAFESELARRRSKETEPAMLGGENDPSQGQAETRPLK